MWVCGNFVMWRRFNIRCAYGLFLFFVIFALTGAHAEQIRVGVLKFGTVNWQLDVVKHNGFDRDEGLDLEVLPLASKNATSIALQAGEADAIVTDWVWALRQRAEGEDFVFVPYTGALGALVVTPASGIDEVAALKGKRIGIAGGPLDKSWLVLRTWSRRELGYDLADEAEAVFAAPPLLSEQLRQGRLDAVLTFWPYAARHKAQGHTILMKVDDILADLGIVHAPPLVGYVFRKTAADERPDAFRALFRAIERANARMRDADEEWERLRPLMKAASDAEFAALRDGYRSGIPESLWSDDLDGARKLFTIMKDIGGAKLLGSAERFEPELFWTPEEQ